MAALTFDELVEIVWEMQKALPPPRPHQAAVSLSASVSLMGSDPAMLQAARTLLEARGVGVVVRTHHTEHGKVEVVESGDTDVWQPARSHFSVSVVTLSWVPPPTPDGAP